MLQINNQEKFFPAISYENLRLSERQIQEEVYRRVVLQLTSRSESQPGKELIDLLCFRYLKQQIRLNPDNFDYELHVPPSKMSSQKLLEFLNKPSSFKYPCELISRPNWLSLSATVQHLPNWKDLLIDRLRHVASPDTLQVSVIWKIGKVANIALRGVLKVEGEFIEDDTVFGMEEEEEIPICYVERLPMNNSLL